MGLEIFAGAKVLVTGHTGFKGSWLCLWLNSLGANITGISDRIPTVPSLFVALGIESIIDHRIIDVENYADVYSVIDEVRPDFIFHLAAQPIVQTSFIDPLRTWHTNTLGTLNVLESIRVCDRPLTAIFVTSDKAYDNVEWEWGYRETDRLGGPDPYSASKGAAELAISSYVRSYFDQSKNIKIGVGRAGNVIGGGDWADARIVPDIARAWSSGEDLTLRNPNSTRPWQHVLEPLSGYIQLALELESSREFHGEAFNFGPSTIDNFSVLNVVEGMAQHWLGHEWVIDSNGEYGKKESKLLKLNCDKAYFHLSWSPVWGFDRTIQETAVWYRDFYSDSKTPIRELSLGQINQYRAEAAQQGLRWAQ